MSIEIRPIKRDEIPAELDLMERVSGSDGPKSTIQTMGYKLYDNPYACNVCAFGAFDGDLLVGMDAYMPAKYVYGEKIFLGVQTCDSFVDPHYQRQGIFTSLTNTAEKYFASQGFDFFIGNPNEKSYPTYLKQNWMEITRGRYIHIPLSPSSMVKIVLKINIPYWMDGIYSAVCFRRNRHCKKGSELIVSEVNASSPEVLLNRVDCIEFAMLREQIQWKLFSKKFLFFVIKSGESLVARYIIKQTGLIADIVEHSFFSECESEIIASIAVLAETLKERGFGVLSCWTPLDKKSMRFFKKNGGIVYDPHPKGMPMMIKILTEDERKKAILSDPEKWNTKRIEVDVVLDNFNPEVQDREYF